MRKLNTIAIVILLSASLLGAQISKVNGRVIDPTGAVLPGADVQLVQGTTVIVKSVTDGNGTFAFDAPPGDYRLEVEVGTAFTPVRQNVRVAPNMGRITITMKLAGLNTSVDVGLDTGQVSIDSDASLTSSTLSKDVINALPDDEDQLLAQLQQIAGASGAANTTATVVVDGFTGGKIPPKDQIQQIIMDSNTFSADGTGGPRIQIITKPGTGPWSGSISSSFGDDSLNARNPFEANKPPRRQHIFQTNYGGPVIPGKLTLRLIGRSIQQDIQSGSVLAITPSGPVRTGVFTPIINRSANLMGQLYFSQANTLNFGGSYNTNANKNTGVGGFSLPERATNFKGHNWGVQLSERAIFNAKINNEARFSYTHNQNSSLPVTEDYAINVIDAFNGGGAQNRARRRGTFINIGDTVRWTPNAILTLVIGSDAMYADNYSAVESNYLGAWTFSSLDDYIAGHPIQFRKTTGNPEVDVKQWDVSAFIQSDWRLTPKLNLSLGARYQVQTNLDDYNNLAPTFQIAYQLHPKTVVRAGGRLTYQGFFLANTEQLLRGNGSNQFETVILNPTTFPVDPTLTSTGATTPLNGGSIRSRAADLVAPYVINSAATFEQTLPQGWRVSASFDMSRGVHLIRTRNINAPFPGTPLSADLSSRLNSPIASVQTAARAEVDRMRPLYPIIGNVNMFESAGASLSKNLNLRIFPPATLRVFGVGIGGQAQYTLGYSQDQGSTQNQWDWNSEWSRTSFDTRHRLQGFLNLTLPRTITATFNVFANSGRPYSLTTGRDNNGDQSTNDRPAGTGRNTLVGPGSYNIGANFSKTFPLRKQEGAGPAAAVANAPQQILVPPPGAVLIGGPGLGAPSSSVTGPRLVFNVNVSNLLNHTQVTGYSGVITSPLFGKPTGAAPGRTLNLGLALNW